MKFDAIWKTQLDFNELVHGKLSDMNEVEINDWTKQMILELFSEVNEFLREINFKRHRKPTMTIKSNMIEEWIDIFKYWLTIGLLQGWTPENFLDEYKRKSDVVLQRYQQENEIDYDNDKMVALDIDGVLAKYPESFQNFIKEKTGVYVELQGYDLYEEYGMVIGRDIVEDLKCEYRESGQKRYIPLMYGAKSLCNRLHKKGYIIIFFTSRPVKEYKRIEADTNYWLKHNNLMLKGDAIMWDEEKNYKAIRNFPNIEFMVEDNSKYAENVAKLGYKVYLLNHRYNQDAKHKNIIRIKRLGEINV